MVHLEARDSSDTYEFYSNNPDVRMRAYVSDALDQAAIDDPNARRAARLVVEAACMSSITEEPHPMQWHSRAVRAGNLELTATNFHAMQLAAYEADRSLRIMRAGVDHE